MAGLWRVRNTVTTPIGDLVLVTDGDGVLHGAEWADCLDRLPAELGRSARGRLPQAVSAAVRDYFDGAVAALESIRVAARGTPFQRAVWEALRAIPPGTTLTYGALARMLGRPGGARSVGHANGANPISVVVPCHRLVAAGGSLTGYGGGLDRKQWLLAHEARHGRHRAAVPGGG
jgi:methylated-DNA-[protein]-cysteine S-methyltransferase